MANAALVRAVGATENALVETARRSIDKGRSMILARSPIIRTWLIVTETRPTSYLSTSPLRWLKLWIGT